MMTFADVERDRKREEEANRNIIYCLYTCFATTDIPKFNFTIFYNIQDSLQYFTFKLRS